MKIKIIHFYLILFVAYSCENKREIEVIDNFVIFGYSGFVVKDSSKHLFDSTKLDIKEYLEYKNHESTKIAKRYNNKSLEYFTLNTINSDSLNKLFNLLLSIRSYQNTKDSNYTALYDGFYYSIYFKTSKNREVEINYAPYRLNDSLKLIHNYFINQIEGALTLRNRFNLNIITSKVASKLYKAYPPPPPPELEQIVKFIAPVWADTIK